MAAPLSSLARWLRAFRRSEKGSAALETLIIAPLLFWGFCATFVIFDAYRQHSLNQKAAYTLGDLVSRQPDALDQAFLNGAQQLFQDLVRNSEDASLRITSVWYDADNDLYRRHWSRAIGDALAAGDAEVAGWATRLPIMPDDEHITVVETWIPYSAPFDVGIVDHDIHNFIFTRPRYAPRICWEAC